MSARRPLERVELREIELPLKAPFETSFGRVARRRILIVRVFACGGMSGYGECVAGDTPFDNHETIDTAWLMTTKYILPLLQAARITRAGQVRDALAVTVRRAGTIRGSGHRTGSQRSLRRHPDGSP